MCGIVGGFLAQQRVADWQSALQRLAHRGPDAQALWQDADAGVALGHTRLSIVDLSAAANQPFTSACGRYVLVYNGELYNFQTLAVDKLAGFRWRTHSDTEVVVELFARYGTDSFAWLNGMFAFSIWDKATQTLYLVRDRLGIKPLFWWRQSAAFVFGSELKLFPQLVAGLTRDTAAYAAYLHTGFIPEPRTRYAEVAKFPAGHYAQWSKLDGAWTLERYADLADDYQIRPDISAAEAQWEYHHLLRQVVKDQLVADVPVGAFLSGGIDSSLVTAVAVEQNANLNSFSIGFAEAGFNECKYAKAVAEYLGTQHREWVVSPNELANLLPKWAAIYDEPLADSSVFPTLLVSQLARQQVTVGLSGDGGDETFLGYGAYTWARRLANPKAKYARWLSQMVPVDRFPDSYRKAARLLQVPKHDHAVPAHIFSQEQGFFTAKEIGQLMPEVELPLLFTPLPDARTLPPEEAQAWWDLHYYLKDDLLVKVDRASMHYGLEIRVPLLDQRLVAFSRNIALAEKIGEDGLSMKWLMRQELFKLVPQELFDRPKRGFAMPLAQWMRSDWQFLIDRYLNEAVVRQTGLVEWRAVEPLLRAYRGGDDFHYHRIWALVVLHLFEG